MQTDVLKPVVMFRNFVNMPKNGTSSILQQLLKAVSYTNSNTFATDMMTGLWKLITPKRHYVEPELGPLQKYELM